MMKKLPLFIIMAALTSCLQAQRGPAASEIVKTVTPNIMKPSMIHTVFFWTKEGTTEQQKGDFEKGLAKLGTCPQIQAFHWGPPAPTEARGVVDNTYDYAINVHFATVKDQNEYQSEPIHLEFIENHKDLWEKVIVYDNVVK